MGTRCVICNSQLVGRENRFYVPLRLLILLSFRQNGWWNFVNRSKMIDFARRLGKSRSCGIALLRHDMIHSGSTPHCQSPLWEFVMAPHFFAPNGSRDGYEQIGSLAPDSVSLVRMFEGTGLQIGLRDGAGFDISTSVESIASNSRTGEKPGPNGSRMLMLRANNAGICQLITKTGGVQSVVLDIVVLPPADSKHSSKLKMMPVGIKSLPECRRWIDET